MRAFYKNFRFDLIAQLNFVKNDQQDELDRMDVVVLWPKVFVVLLECRVVGLRKENVMRVLLLRGDDYDDGDDDEHGDVWRCKYR